jgi:Flp pilus assembly pilin Flp
MSMRLRPRRLVCNSGQALVEYAVILALASLGIISVLMILQGSIGGTMLGASSRLDAAGGAPAGEARPGEPLGGETGTAKPGKGDDGWNDPGHSGEHGKGTGGGDYGSGRPHGR